MSWGIQRIGCRVSELNVGGIGLQSRIDAAQESEPERQRSNRRAKRAPRSYSCGVLL